jgi:hypothetical protein
VGFSQAQPSSTSLHQIPCLSDFGRFLISTALKCDSALRSVSAGYRGLGAGPGPLEDYYDLIARTISKERPLDKELIEVTIPSLLADAANEYEWETSMPWKGSAGSYSFEQLKRLVRRPIARWTATISRPVIPDHTHRSAPNIIQIKLSDLPRNRDEEPQDPVARLFLRKAAIDLYKDTWRDEAGRKPSDADIALQAHWRDRTAVTRFKRCDLRNSSEADARIWRVLGSAPNHLTRKS